MPAFVKFNLMVEASYRKSLRDKHKKKLRFKIGIKNCLLVSSNKIGLELVLFLYPKYDITYAFPDINPYSERISYTNHGIHIHTIYFSFNILNPGQIVSIRELFLT